MNLDLFESAHMARWRRWRTLKWRTLRPAFLEHRTLLRGTAVAQPAAEEAAEVPDHLLYNFLSGVRCAAQFSSRPRPATVLRGSGAAA